MKFDLNFVYIIIQVIFLALFFLTPGVYTLQEVIKTASPFFIKIYLLNPLVGLLNLYRIVFIRGYLNTLPKEVNLLNTLISPVLCSGAILFVGYFIFNRYEERFPDYF